jgi:hypothetical protein
MASIIPPVFPIDNSLAYETPFVDWLSFTVPAIQADFVVSEFDSIFSLFGATRDDNQLYRFRTSHGYGTCKIDAKNEFYVFSISGEALRYIRQFELIQDVLYAISLVTHKITRLDVACDFNIESHLAIGQLSNIAYRGEAKLTRKSIKPGQVKEILSADIQGNKTGTLYLGHRSSSDVCCRIYDKAHERYQKSAIIPTEHRLRIEFTFKGLALPTLRDVSLPSDIFYYHACQTLVKPPSTFKTWESHGEGFTIQKKASKTPYQRMRGLFEFSSDIEQICELAIKEFGDSAPYELGKLFQQRVKKSLRGMGWNPMQASLF